MKFHRLYVAAMLLSATASTLAAEGAKKSHWVTSWYASPQPVWRKDFPLPTQLPELLHEQTVRETVRISSGGGRLRVSLSNSYGKAPVLFGEVHVAEAGDGSAIVEGSDRRLSFGGRHSVTVPPGATVVSDPVDLEVRPLSRLAVSSYFPRPTSPETFHWGDQQIGYIAAGNATGSPRIDAQRLLKGRMFLTGVLVDAAPETRTVVVFGDSITDGNGSTPDRNRRWPDFLAERFAGAGVAVANAGISGARLLTNGMGENALARFGHDVLGQPGVRTVVLLMGINDIGWPGGPFAPHEAPVTADELIAGYRQLIAQARMHDIRIVGATLLPFEGALRGTPLEGHYSIEKERLRQAVNHWIRSAGEFDAIADFDALMRDPDRPARLSPAFDSGDHLHPGDAGYKAMADMLDMAALFGDGNCNGTGKCDCAARRNQGAQDALERCARSQVSR
ncbi:SGNH/GDSL hydrolase family protein [Noviherbaspirillum sp. CPCC 100848]|uniref:SGNH/GDSL hydrolase family protein n=1 Tax=Noviherbaspirillum album TaxID=3080276 RepID=A0ABU6JBD3_9BURK|nr:SGNH/GDSL hydrolase family protein [Noviherbaspirillum sp. CPCC 100848]MEC4720946.1 SGNH/GDSL hydrolase family protein [Noviherbaspirillum sp. CPCC 100848]